MIKTPASNAGSTGSIPGRGTKIKHAVQFGKKKKVETILRNHVHCDTPNKETPSPPNHNQNISKPVLFHSGQI